MQTADVEASSGGGTAEPLARSLSGLGTWRSGVCCADTHRCLCLNTLQRKNTTRQAHRPIRTLSLSLCFLLVLLQSTACKVVSGGGGWVGGGVGNISRYKKKKRKNNHTCDLIDAYANEVVVRSKEAPYGRWRRSDGRRL